MIEAEVGVEVLHHVVGELGAWVSSYVVDEAEGADILEESSGHRLSVFGGGSVAEDVVGEEVDDDEEVEVTEAVSG